RARSPRRRRRRAARAAQRAPSIVIALAQTRHPPRVAMRTAMTARLLVCIACTVATAHAAPDRTPLRRFALVIGSNDGGGERERLRYAGHDAATMADVLQQLGGVNRADLSLLNEPAPRDVDGAFDALSHRVRGERQQGQRVELVVYYSGHADETGILIGG